MLTIAVPGFEHSSWTSGFAHPGAISKDAHRVLRRRADKKVRCGEPRVIECAPDQGRQLVDFGELAAIPPSLTHNFFYRANVIASSFCFMIIVVWFTGQGMLQGPF